MSERDYFDLPDDELDHKNIESQSAPIVPPRPVQSVQTVESYDDPGMPVARRHVGKSLLAIAIFIVILGGCAFMIWHQVQGDLKPHKSTTQK